MGGWHLIGHPVLPGHPCCHRTLCRGAQPHASLHGRDGGCRVQPAPWGGESWWERSTEPQGGTLGGRQWSTRRISWPP